MKPKKNLKNSKKKKKFPLDLSKLNKHSPLQSLFFHYFRISQKNLREIFVHGSGEKFVLVRRRFLEGKVRPTKWAPREEVDSSRR